MAGSSKLKPIHKVRKKNLTRVIDAKFQGNASECARAIDRSHTFMWQLVKGYRGIGEASARHIEQALDLPPNALDLEEDKRTERLVASDGRGNSESYNMVPLVTMSTLDEVPQKFVPCLGTECGPKTMAVVIEDEDVNELRAGDTVCLDRGDLAVLPEKLYAVRLKGAKFPVMMASVKTPRGVKLVTNKSRTVEYAVNDMVVLGRVKMIMRPR